MSSESRNSSRMRRSPDLTKQFLCNQQFVRRRATAHKTQLKARKSPVQLHYNQHLRDALASAANTELTARNFRSQALCNQHFCDHSGSVHSTGLITQLESILTRPNTRKPTIINTSKIQGDTPIFKAWSNTGRVSALVPSPRPSRCRRLFLNRATMEATATENCNRQVAISGENYGRIQKRPQRRRTRVHHAASHTRLKGHRHWHRRADWRADSVLVVVARDAHRSRPRWRRNQFGGAAARSFGNSHSYRLGTLFAANHADHRISDLRANGEMDQGRERRTSHQRRDGLQLQRRHGDFRGRFPLVRDRAVQGSRLLREVSRRRPGSLHARHFARHRAQLAERSSVDLRGRRYLRREKSHLSKSGGNHDSIQAHSRGSGRAAVWLYRSAARSQRDCHSYHCKSPGHSAGRTCAQ